MAAAEAIQRSIITCPACGAAAEEQMPADACQFFYECGRCRTLLRPRSGDCCVFCSYGSVKCPSVQLAIMSKASDNLKALEGLVEAFNAHDLDKVMSYFAEDCSLDMPRGKSPWGARYVGKEQVRAGLRTRFEMLPDVHYGEDRHWATDTMGVSEWLLTGTLRSGEKIAVRGCDHYEFRDGKVVRKDSYWKIVE